MRYSFFVLFLLSSSYSFAMDPPEEPSGRYTPPAQAAVPQGNDAERVPIVPVATSENNDPEEWGPPYEAFLRYLQLQKRKGVKVNEEILDEIVALDPTREDCMNKLRRHVLEEIQNEGAVQIPEESSPYWRSTFWKAGHLSFLRYLERQIDNSIAVDYDAIARLVDNDPIRDGFLREVSLLMAP